MMDICLYGGAIGRGQRLRMSLPGSDFSWISCSTFVLSYDMSSFVVILNWFVTCKR